MHHSLCFQKLKPEGDWPLTLSALELTITTNMGLLNFLTPYVFQQLTSDFFSGSISLIALFNSLSSMILQNGLNFFDPRTLTQRRCVTFVLDRTYSTCVCDISGGVAACSFRYSFV